MSLGESGALEDWMLQSAAGRPQRLLCPNLHVGVVVRGSGPRPEALDPERRASSLADADLWCGSDR